MVFVMTHSTAEASILPMNPNPHIKSSINSIFKILGNYTIIIKYLVKSMTSLSVAVSLFAYAEI